MATTSANVLITVELIVDAKDDKSAIEEAKRVMTSALDCYDNKTFTSRWHRIARVEVIHLRDE